MTLMMLFAISMVITSSSPLMMWMWMEISGLIFIMVILMVHTTNINVSAPMLMIQFSGSVLMIVGILMELSTSLEMGIILKIGMFPFHMWMPMIMTKLTWNISLILMTLQKLPAFLFMYMTTNKLIMITSMIVTPVVATVKLMSVLGMKQIMAYSSTIHSSWMMLSMFSSNQLWMIYFLIYSINTYMVCKMVNNSYTPTSVVLKKFILMIMLSLVGVPPMMGFISKAFVMIKMTPLNLIPMATLILSSAMSMIFYMRLFLSYTLSPKPEMKSINMKPKISVMKPQSLIILLLTFVLM